MPTGALCGRKDKVKVVEKIQQEKWKGGRGSDTGGKKGNT
jgi:hypothetical protein